MAGEIGSADLIYEAIGAANPAFSLLRLLNNNGVFIFTGIPGKNESIPMPADLIMKSMVLKNQVLLGTVNARKYNFSQSIDDLNQCTVKWPNLLNTLLTKHISISHPSLQDVLLGKLGGIKNVITL